MSQISNYGIFGLFLTVAFIIIFGSHFFIYFSLVNFFRIASGASKTILGAALGLLPILFFISTFLARWKENQITTAFYFASSLWLGIMVELFFAFLLGWMIIAIIKISGFNANTENLGVAILTAVFLLTVFGMWNVYHPQIRKISVKISGLPRQWQGKTAVQVSDVHLGHVLGKNFFRGVISQVNSQKPDMVFITGDLFDGMDGKLADMVLPMDELEAPEGVFYVTGNHETYLGVQKVYAALKNTKVKVLNDEMVMLDGMQVIGISYPKRGERKNNEEIIKNLPGFDPNVPVILLYHSPTQLEAAKNQRIDFQLSGHTHKGQIFPLRIFTYLIYKGYDHGLFKEGDFTLYTSSGTGTWGPTIRTGNRPEIVVINFE